MGLENLNGSHIRAVGAIPVMSQLTIDVFGPEHSGKSHFALSAAGKRGTFYQSTETKSLDGVIQKFADKPIRVGMYKADIPHGIDRGQHEQLQKYFKAELKKLKDDYNAAMKAKIGVVVHDKSVGVWEIMRLAHFGKLEGVTAKNYGPLNIEFADMLDQAPENKTTLILINEEMDEWGPSASGKGRETTGRKIRKGQDRTGFLVDLSMRMSKARTAKGMTFYGEIVEARANQDLIGAVLENPTFLDVATLFRPEIDWQTELGL